MSYNLDYDTSGRIIYITTAPSGGNLSLSVPKDIYSAAKWDWLNDAALNKFKFPLSEPVGGNVIVPGKLLSPYIYIRYNWRMRPYEADHTLYLTEGSLVEPAGADPWLPTIGNYTVNIRDVIPSDARTLETGVSGLTAQESQNLQDIATDQSTINTNIGTIQGDIATINVNISNMGGDMSNMEAEMVRSLGLMQENYCLDNCSYIDVQGQKLMTSGRMRLYSNPASVGTDNDVAHTYLITGMWSGQELIKYTVVHQ